MINKYLVAKRGDEIVIGLPMRTARMSIPDAMGLAAYLLALSEDEALAEMIYNLIFMEGDWRYASEKTKERCRLKVAPFLEEMAKGQQSGGT